LGDAKKIKSVILEPEDHNSGTSGYIYPNK